MSAPICQGAPVLLIGAWWPTLPSLLLPGPGMVWLGWHLRRAAELINVELKLLTELPSWGAGEPLEPTLPNELPNCWLWLPRPKWMAGVLPWSSLSPVITVFYPHNYKWTILLPHHGLQSCGLGLRFKLTFNQVCIFLIWLPIWY